MTRFRQLRGTGKPQKPQSRLVRFKARGKQIAFKTGQGAKKAAKFSAKHGKSAAKKGIARYQTHERNKRLRRYGILAKCPICNAKHVEATPKAAKAWVRRHVNAKHL